MVNLNTKIKRINVECIIPIEYERHNLKPNLEIGYINNLIKLEKRLILYSLINLCAIVILKKLKI